MGINLISFIIKVIEIDKILIKFNGIHLDQLFFMNGFCRWFWDIVFDLFLKQKLFAFDLSQLHLSVQFD